MGWPIMELVNRWSTMELGNWSCTLEPSYRWSLLLVAIDLCEQMTGGTQLSSSLSSLRIGDWWDTRSLSSLRIGDWWDTCCLSSLKIGDF